MLTHEQVQTSLQTYFGNVGAVKARGVDTFEVEITGGNLGDSKLNESFRTAIHDKTGFIAVSMMAHGTLRSDALLVIVPPSHANDDTLILDPAVIEAAAKEAATAVTSTPDADFEALKRKLDAAYTAQDKPSAEASVTLPDAPETDGVRTAREFEFLEHLDDDDEPLPDVDDADDDDHNEVLIWQLTKQNADLQTSVNLLEGMHEEDQRVIHLLRKVNTAQSEMLRNEVIMPDVKPTQVEIKTLMHRPALMESDEELGRCLSEGWQVLNIAVYVNDDLTWRTVTLIREVAAPTQPQPEKTVTAPNGVMERGARNGVFPPIPRPTRIERRPAVPVFAQNFAEQNPHTVAVLRGNVEAWRDEQNQSNLDAAMREFRASLVDVPPMKALPLALKARD